MKIKIRVYMQNLPMKIIKKKIIIMFGYSIKIFLVIDYYLFYLSIYIFIYYLIIIYSLNFFIYYLLIIILVFFK